MRRSLYKGKRRWWLWLLVWFPLLVLFGLGLEFARASSELDATKARARKLGLPVSPDQVKPGPKPKSEDNAGPLLAKAADLYRNDPSTVAAMKKLADVGIPPTTSKPCTVKPGEALALFKNVEPLMKLGREAATKPACDFDYDWTQGMKLMFPEPAGVKAIVKVCSSRAVFLALGGKQSEALDEISVCSKVCELVGQTPTLVHMLVAIACDGMTLRSYEDLLSVWADSPSNLAKVKSSFNAMKPLPSYRAAMRSEAWLVPCGLRRIANLGELPKIAELAGEAKVQPKRNEPFPKQDPVVRTVTQAMEARYIQAWCETFERWGDTDDVLKMGEIQAEMDKKIQRTRGLSNIGNKALFPVFTQVADAYVRAQANRKCVKALLAVLEFRASHRRLPKTLAEAGVSEIDPFDGQPLRYVVSGNTCKVYSVGQDKVDDGGLRRSGATEKNSDVVVQYPSLEGRYVR